ncbi:MAG: response regulator transcription factor [Candidatus Methylomirabilales bacterium]
MKRGRVLLADSHQNMLESIRGLLETMFEAVVMVADETSLLEAADMLKPDLAVVDLSLPASGEVNVARRLKSRHPELKVLILSVHDEATVVKEILAAGAGGFVLKRSAATDLVPAVQEVLQGGTYISPAAERRGRKSP